MTAKEKASGKLKESLEQAQARLATFEEEAQRVVQDLVEKGRSTRKEVATLLQQINAKELLEGEYVKGLSGKAKGVGEELNRRVEEVRTRAMALAGVASRDQVDDLSKELDKLSSKLDKLLAESGVTAPKDTKREE